MYKDFVHGVGVIWLSDPYAILGHNLYYYFDWIGDLLV